MVILGVVLIDVVLEMMFFIVVILVGVVVVLIVVVWEVVVGGFVVVLVVVCDVVGDCVIGLMDCIGILLDWLDEIFIEVWDVFDFFEVSLGDLFFVLLIFFLLFVFL